MSDPTDEAGVPTKPLGGRYRLESVLGRGATGAVYRATDAQTGETVAVKVLRPELASDAAVVTRFIREADVAVTLEHQNIVRMLDRGHDTETGSLYLVQELLVGRDLRALLEETPRLEIAAAVDIALPIMAALTLAHERGVVHRDIKPENIFLARRADGVIVPKLIDFGMSKQTRPGPNDIRLTQTGMAVGTPFYMSPEQARGDKTVDAQTDVWAAATVLYELIAGRCPFDAPNFSMLIYLILTTPAPRIETHVPEIPRTLADAIHRGLDASRERRYSSMRAFVRVLLDCPALAAATGAPSLRERHARSLDARELAADSIGATMAVATLGSTVIATGSADSPPRVAAPDPSATAAPVLPAPATRAPSADAGSLPTGAFATSPPTAPQTTPRRLGRVVVAVAALALGFAVVATIRVLGSSSTAAVTGTRPPPVEPRAARPAEASPPPAPALLAPPVAITHEVVPDAATELANADAGRSTHAAEPPGNHRRARRPLFIAPE